MPFIPENITWTIIDDDYIERLLTYTVNGVSYRHFFDLEIDGTPEADTIFARPYILNGETWGTFAHGHGGDDTLRGGLQADLYGDDGDDKLYYAERIAGGAGNDTLWANEHVGSSMDGGTGHDKLFGSDAGNTMRGDDGNDSLWGGAWMDRIEGGDGHDKLWGGAAADRVSGDAGNDSLWGEDGNDTLDGGAGDDKLWGGIDDDTLSAGTGDDRLWGGDGDDRLTAGSGTDHLWGGDGDDTLIAGSDWSGLSGGAGADTFVITGTRTVVKDFDPAEVGELLDISGLSGIAHFWDLRSQHIRSSDAASITFEDDTGATFLLMGVTLADLSADDFLF